MLRVLMLVFCPLLLLSGLAIGETRVDTPSPDWQETLHKLDSQPVQPGTAMPDISAILQAGAAQQQQAQSVIDKLLAESRSPAQTNATDEPIVPLVFVSFSMPDASLKQLLRDAGKVGAQLILNGLVDDDLKATSRRLLTVQGIDPEADSLSDYMTGAEVAGMGIDPTLFERLNIQHVPTFVLPLEPVQACAEGQGCPPFRHIRVSGDVSLAYALDKFTPELDQASGLQQQVRQWVKRLQGEDR